MSKLLHLKRVCGNELFGISVFQHAHEIEGKTEGSVCNGRSCLPAMSRVDADQLCGTLVGSDLLSPCSASLCSVHGTFARHLGDLFALLGIYFLQPNEKAWQHAFP